MKITDCRLCAEISKSQGEDPIGTAGTYEQWLILELEQPWSPLIWVEDPRVLPLLNAIKELSLRRNLHLRVLAIAPDPEYSRADHVRLFYYHRTERHFSEFHKQEFLVPQTQWLNCAIDVLKTFPGKPSPFEHYRQPCEGMREIFVCTHANVDISCGRFGYPIYKKLRSEYATESEGKLRVWRCSHFGGHQFAPTLLDFPAGRCWGHLEPEILDHLIYQQGDVTALRSFYRGWSGLKPLEQVVEREIWMREGWDWLNYDKSAYIQDLEGMGLLKYAYLALQKIPLQTLQILLERWAKAKIVEAKICIEFSQGDTQSKEAYEAIVEKAAPVMSVLHSGQEMTLQPVPQYRVRNLFKKKC